MTIQNKNQQVGSVLEKFHFSEIDKGTSVETTSLKRHERREVNLAPEAARLLQIKESEARALLDSAVATVISRTSSTAAGF